MANINIHINNAIIQNGKVIADEEEQKNLLHHLLGVVYTTREVMDGIKKLKEDLNQGGVNVFLDNNPQYMKPVFCELVKSIEQTNCQLLLVNVAYNQCLILKKDRAQGLGDIKLRSGLCSDLSNSYCEFVDLRLGQFLRNSGVQLLKLWCKFSHGLRKGKGQIKLSQILVILKDMKKVFQDLLVSCEALKAQCYNPKNMENQSNGCLMSKATHIQNYVQPIFDEVQVKKHDLSKRINQMKLDQIEYEKQCELFSQYIEQKQQSIKEEQDNIKKLKNEKFRNQMIGLGTKMAELSISAISPSQANTMQTINTSVNQIMAPENNIIPQIEGLYKKIEDLQVEKSKIMRDEEIKSEDLKQQLIQQKDEQIAQLQTQIKDLQSESDSIDKAIDKSQDLIRDLRSELEKQQKFHNDYDTKKKQTLQQLKQSNIDDDSLSLFFEGIQLLVCQLDKFKVSLQSIIKFIDVLQDRLEMEFQDFEMEMESLQDEYDEDQNKKVKTQELQDFLKDINPLIYSLLLISEVIEDLDTKRVVMMVPSDFNQNKQFLNRLIDAESLKLERSYNKY